MQNANSNTRNEYNMFIRHQSFFCYCSIYIMKLCFPFISRLTGFLSTQIGKLLPLDMSK